MNNKRRLNVHLYVTPICNLNCKHCYYNAKSIDNIPEDLLSIDEISFMIKKLCDKYEAAFDVEGGAFFLREDIGELFNVLPKCYWNNITVTTSGTVKIGINPKYLLWLDEFRVSVEGHTDEIQHDLRGVKLEPVLKTCNYLSSHDIPIILRVTLHKKNYKYLFEMLNHFVALGFKKFSFYEFQPVGRGGAYKNEYSLGEAEIDHVFNLLSSNIISNEIEMLKLNFGRRRIPLLDKYKTKLFRYGYIILNLAGIPSLTINYNGNLGVCPWNIDDTPIGIFYKKTFELDIGRYMEAGLLEHECDYCSAIRILYQGKKS